MQVQRDANMQTKLTDFLLVLPCSAIRQTHLGIEASMALHRRELFVVTGLRTSYGSSVVVWVGWREVDR